MDIADQLRWPPLLPIRHPRFQSRPLLRLPADHENQFPRPLPRHNLDGNDNLHNRACGRRSDPSLPMQTHPALMAPPHTRKVSPERHDVLWLSGRDNSVRFDHLLSADTVAAAAEYQQEEEVRAGVRVSAWTVDDGLFGYEDDSDYYDCKDWELDYACALGGH